QPCPARIWKVADVPGSIQGGLYLRGCYWPATVAQQVQSCSEPCKQRSPSLWAPVTSVDAYPLENRANARTQLGHCLRLQPEWCWPREFSDPPDRFLAH